MERLDTLVARVLVDARRAMDERAARAKRRPESPGCDGDAARAHAASLPWGVGTGRCAASISSRETGLPIFSEASMSAGQ